MQKTYKVRDFEKNKFFRGFLHLFQLKNEILKKENIISDMIFYKESESGIIFEDK